MGKQDRGRGGLRGWGPREEKGDRASASAGASEERRTRGAG